MIKLRGRARRFVARSWTLSWFYYRLHGLPLAGPPDEQVWYFAYGANMHDRAFRERRRMRPIDQRIGRIRGYRPRHFEAEDRDGRLLPAVAYIARGNATDGAPSLRYLTLLREGARANGLPGHWLQFLDSVEHARSVDAKR